MGLFKEFYLSESLAKDMDKKAWLDSFRVVVKTNRGYFVKFGDVLPNGKEDVVYTRDISKAYVWTSMTVADMNAKILNGKVMPFKDIRESIDESIEKKDYIVKKESLIDWIVKPKDNTNKWIAHITKEKIGFNVNFKGDDRKDNKYFFRSYKDALTKRLNLL